MNRRQALHHVARGYDSTVTCLIRDDTGPVDLAGKVLDVHLRPYASRYRYMALPATSDVLGEAVFTVPASSQTNRLNESLYRIDLTADGVLIYEALLEIT